MILPEYVRRPESLPGVDAIRYTGHDSGRRIVAWVEKIRGRGAAVYEEDTLRLFVEEFGGAAIELPHGWVVYREFLSSRFHVAPKDLFDQMYEPRA